MSNETSDGKSEAKQLSELAKMIEYMARMLVDLSDQVSVYEIVGENTTVIELKVAKEDLGKIIGKQGRTARSIRTILNGASTKLRKRTVLEIIE
ncbi:KH domain-containing protein [Bdellovibrionota bacterium FG-1]